MTIETLITKFLNKIAKTKRESSLFGGLFIGFALGICFFAPGSENIFNLVAQVAVISTLLFLGLCLIIRRSAF